MFCVRCQERLLRNYICTKYMSLRAAIDYPQVVCVCVNVYSLISEYILRWMLKLIIDMIDNTYQT